MRRIERATWPGLLSGLLLALLAESLVSLCFGAVPLPLADIVSLLYGAADPQTTLIVVQLRLPRTVLALCVGAMLASSGAVAQGLFRNPLADPSLIGVAAGASVGASIVIVLLGAVHWPILGLSLVSLGAFVGAMSAVVVIYRVAADASGVSVSAMLLAGIAISFLAGSFSGVLEFIADNEALRRMSLWRMGGLERAGFGHAGISALLCTVVLAAFSRHRLALNALLLGESEALHLGIPVPRVKLELVALVALAVGASVALAGVIAFVGLIVPHAVRMLLGPDHRYVLPLSAVCGAGLLVLADTLARTVVAPVELPLGLITALIGAPVFIALLRRRRDYGMH